MRKIGLILLFLIAAALSIFLFFSATSDGDNIVVDMEGTQLNIPKHYFNFQPSSSKISGSILLEVAWPDALSSGSPALQKFKTTWRSENSIGWIYAAPKSEKRSFEDLLIYDPAIPEQGNFFGLEKSKKTHGKVHKREYEIYTFKNDSGKIETYIECVVSGLIPSCKQRFYYKNIYIQITYNRERYLQKWQSLQKTVYDLFESFLIN